MKHKKGVRGLLAAGLVVGSLSGGQARAWGIPNPFNGGGLPIPIPLPHPIPIPFPIPTPIPAPAPLPPVLPNLIQCVVDDGKIGDAEGELNRKNEELNGLRNTNNGLSTENQQLQVQNEAASGRIEGQISQFESTRLEAQRATAGAETDADKIVETLTALHAKVKDLSQQAVTNDEATQSVLKAVKTTNARIGKALFAGVDTTLQPRQPLEMEHPEMIATDCEPAHGYAYARDIFARLIQLQSTLKVASEKPVATQVKLTATDVESRLKGLGDIKQRLGAAKQSL